MFRKTISILALFSLTSCGGVLVYDNDEKLFIGILDDRNLNEMNSTGQVHSLGSHDRMVYAIDAGGALVGACRTTLHSANNQQAGEVDLHVFTAARQPKFSASNKTIIREIDDFADTPWESALAPPHRYLHCYKMGASNTKSNLVIYFQPQGFEENPLDFAIEVNVAGTRLEVVDHEAFPRGSAPSRVVARDNPLKGNTVGVLSNRLHINGTSVSLNGNPVGADGVKHYFK